MVIDADTVSTDRRKRTAPGHQLEDKSGGKSEMQLVSSVMNNIDKLFDPILEWLMGDEAPLGFDLADIGCSGKPGGHHYDCLSLPAAPELMSKDKIYKIVPRDMHIDASRLIGMADGP